jgi:hypothetical protein
MKVIVFTLFSACATLALCLFLFGCTTTPQTTAYNTLYTVEQSTTAAYDAYLSAAIQGTVSTNSLPALSKEYNDFQASMAAAVILVQNNTNALASTNLVAEGAAIVTAITTIESNK